MFQIFPLIMALIIAGSLTPGPLPHAGRLLMGLALISLVWCILQTLMAMAVLRWRLIRLLSWWDHLGTLAALALHAFWCWGLRANALVDSTLVAVLPFIGLSILQWLAMDLPIRRLTRADLRPAGLARQRFTLGLLPPLVILALFELVGAATVPLAPLLNGWLDIAVSIVFFPLILVFFPVVVVRLWRTVPLPAGEQRDMIEALCRKAGVRIGGIRLWPCRGGRFYNAAVLGFVPRWRYVLISADLLEALPPDEMAAVVGHELAHIRHRHLLLLLLFLFAGMLWIGNLTVGTESWLNEQTWLAWIPPGPRLALVALSGLVVLAWLGFGPVSRACERQADLGGAELVGSPEAMTRALASVARLAGMEETDANFRHGSIADRKAFLTEVGLDPDAGTWHHRRLMKLRILIFLAFFAALLFVPHLNRPRSLPSWRQNDLRLDMALSKAEQGDATLLRLWLSDASRIDRLDLANYILELSRERTQTPTSLYRLRNWLIPLCQTDLHDRTRNLAIDNLTAYTLVAGTASPTVEDMTVAQTIRPRLAKALEQDPQHEIFDTLGCILLRLNEREAAAKAFREALRLLGPALDKASAEDRKILEPCRALYQRRLDACTDPTASLPLEEEMAVAPPPPPPGLERPAGR